MIAADAKAKKRPLSDERHSMNSAPDTAMMLGAAMSPTLESERCRAVPSRAGTANMVSAEMPSIASHAIVTS